MKYPFQMSNYPPGAELDPRAPWNLVDIVGDCFECGKSKNADDMSDRELQSYDDNNDGSFCCDECGAKFIDGVI